MNNNHTSVQPILYRVLALEYPLENAVYCEIIGENLTRFEAQQLARQYLTAHSSEYLIDEIAKTDIIGRFPRIIIALMDKHDIQRLHVEQLEQEKANIDNHIRLLKKNFPDVFDEPLIVHPVENDGGE